MLAKAKVSISGTLALSNSTTATNTYTQIIAAGKSGNAMYVSWGKDVSYRKFRLNADCTQTTLSSGRIKYPSISKGWYFWLTSS